MASQSSQAWAAFRRNASMIDVLQGRLRVPPRDARGRRRNAKDSSTHYANAFIVRDGILLEVAAASYCWHLTLSGGSPVVRYRWSKVPHIQFYRDAVSCSSQGSELAARPTGIRSSSGPQNAPLPEGFVGRDHDCEHHNRPR